MVIKTRAKLHFGSRYGLNTSLQYVKQGTAHKQPQPSFNTNNLKFVNKPANNF